MLTKRWKLAVSVQLSALSSQLSAISDQYSVVSFQARAFDPQLSTLDFSPRSDPLTRPAPADESAGSVPPSPARGEGLAILLGGEG
jgi:hypothetical protein